MVSVVCIYNNEKMYKEFVVASLKKQKTPYHLYGIDNSSNIFSSAADAYNSILTQISTETIVFMHQDIAFDQNDFLENIEKVLDSSPDCILGYCGIKKDGLVVSNLKYKRDKRYIVKNQVDALCAVESVDECCFALKTEYLRRIGGFNAQLCDGWHLYAVELCLRAQNMGGRCLVSNDEIFHKWDDGQGLTVDMPFIRVMNRLAKKYNNRKKIYAPCYICATNTCMRQFRLLKSVISYYVKNNFAAL